MSADTRVEIGDRMRFSAALLQQIHAEPEHLSPVVIVTAIDIEADGCKVLYLMRADEGPPRCPRCGSYQWTYKGDRQVCADCGR